MNNNIKKHSKLFIVLIVLPALCAVLVYLYFFRFNPYHSLQTAFSGCKQRAEALIANSGSSQALNRCEIMTWTTSDGLSIDRIFAISGDVTPREEFECGYELDCATYIGWFNQDEQINFIEPPAITSRSPAVNALGCGDVNYRIEDVDPKLVYEDGIFWWSVDYENRSVKERGFSCVIDGSYRVNGNGEIESALRLVDATDRSSCAVSLQFSTCLSAVAIHQKNIEQCKISNPEKDGNIDSHYSKKCITNYTWYFGDTESCEKTTSKFEEMFDCNGNTIQNFRGSTNAVNLNLSGM